jgi:hypothetical protein
MFNFIFEFYISNYSLTYIQSATKLIYLILEDIKHAYNSSTRLRQEDSAFQASLGYTAISYVKKEKKRRKKEEMKERRKGGREEKRKKKTHKKHNILNISFNIFFGKSTIILCASGQCVPLI